MIPVRVLAVRIVGTRVDAGLRGQGCDAPVRTCLTFNSSAHVLIRSGIAESISNDKAMEILQEAKAAGLAQTGDNVREDISYMCNCCGCCCGMMRSIKKYSIYDGIVPSSFRAPGWSAGGCWDTLIRVFVHCFHWLPSVHWIFLLHIVQIQSWLP